MSEITEITEYIYLLQLREFVNNNQNIYKIGRTSKEHLTRFNQYPNGSKLLVQVICEDSKKIEKELLIKFREKYIQKKEIGNEYFEGNYKKMKKDIFNYLDEIDEKNEKELNKENEIEESENKNEKYENEKENESEDEYEITIYESEDEDEEEYEITTYEEWIKFKKISNIIITNKKGEGYIRLNGHPWRILYDRNSEEFDEDIMEDLLGYINYYQDELVIRTIKPREELIRFEELMELRESELNNGTCTYINVKYNNNKIYEDTIKKCYKKTTPKKITLEYGEYIIPIVNKNDDEKIVYVILNTKTFTMIFIDDVKDINNKIILENEKGGRVLKIKEIKNIKNINTEYVNDILNSLIKEDKKEEYHRLMYNLIVNQTEEKIVFNDYGECLLTEWFKDLSYTLHKDTYKLYINSSDYYKDIELKKKIKKIKPRCVIIDSEIKKINIQIEEFTRLGIKNIIICRRKINEEMYNKKKYREKLESMEDLLIECIEENGYDKNKYSNWNNAIQYDDSIFYNSNLMLVNFLKWCCT